MMETIPDSFSKFHKRLREMALASDAKSASDKNAGTSCLRRFTSWLDWRNKRWNSSSLRLTCSKVKAHSPRPSPI